MIVKALVANNIEEVYTVRPSFKVKAGRPLNRTET